MCNLFRDLSDKLFTSEIIDQAKQTKDTFNQATLIISVDFDCPSKEANDVRCTGKSCDLAIVTENKSRLGDLGIVYARRNEDVVNMGPGLQSKQDTAIINEENTPKTSIKTTDKRQDANNNKVENYSLEQKWKECINIAQFMGMGVLEFSKWILPASPSEHDEILQNYNKKKRRSKR